MTAINYSEARANLKAVMDRATDNYETIIVTRKGDRNVVILSEEVYNNLLENAYLTKEKANYDWLMASKKEFEEGKVEKHSLIEEEGTAKK